MCAAYILYSATLNKYYVGYTCDELSERLRKHNTNHKEFTSRTSDWILVYCEVFQNKQAAYAREREIKSWKSRKRIEELITSYRWNSWFSASRFAGGSLVRSERAQRRIHERTNPVSSTIKKLHINVKLFLFVDWQNSSAHYTKKPARHTPHGFYSLNHLTASH